MATAKLHGGDVMKRTLARLGADAERALGAALYAEASIIMAQSKQIVPVDMGTLRSSGHVQLPETHGSKVSVRLGYGGAAAKYAVYVHEGTGPAVGRPAFFPPIAALRDWMSRHGIPEKSYWVVARAIGSKGRKPTKFLERPFRAATVGMLGRIAGRLRAELLRARA